MPSARAHAATGVLAALALLLATTPPSDAALRCYSYAVKVPNAPFGYKAGFPSWIKSCDAYSYNISKLYMKYSCVTTRDNNFLTRPTECPGGLAVLDGSTETCSSVFGYGPKGAFTQAAQITGNYGFDSGNVCNGGDTGYFFILVDDQGCPDPTPPKVVAAPYTGGKCNRQAMGNAVKTGQASKPLSKSPGKIAGISIGAGLGLLLVTGGLCWLIYYMSQRAGGKPTGAVQSAMMGMGGGAGGGAAAGAGRPNNANLPPGSYVPGAAGATGGAAAAGGPGGYSYKPGEGGGKAGMPLGTQAGGTAPGKAGYPKV